MGLYTTVAVLVLLVGSIHGKPHRHKVTKDNTISSLFEDLGQVLKSAFKDLPDTRHLPKNYHNTTTQIKDINGTQIEANTTVIKSMKNGIQDTQIVQSQGALGASDKQHFIQALDIEMKNSKHHHQKHHRKGHGEVNASNIGQHLEEALENEFGSGSGEVPKI